MLPLVALLLALDVRQIKPGLDGDLPPLLLGGVLSGFAVAFIEETFFRGILFTAVSRASGARAAIIAPTLLYAALHFLGGKLRVPSDEVSWNHGFEVLSRLFERYAQPLAFVDSFLALVALGVLLAMVRLRTGAIAGCIGLHAAGVCAIFVLRDTTTVNGQAPFNFIVQSSFPVFESKARKRASSVAATNTRPLAVAMVPPLPGRPVFCLPSGKLSVIPSGTFQAILPVLTSTATSSPHGGS
jgi:hypothetical protein